MKNGFTLIELLSVIVILAIILVIAVPQVNKTINASQKGSFESDTKIILGQIEMKSIDRSIDITTIDETNIESMLGIKADNYENITVTKISGKPYILVKGKNKWNGLLSYGTYEKVTVLNNTNYNTVFKQLGYNTEKGVNEPKLSLGMTPIKWDGTKWISTTEDDINWYDYSAKNWANVKTQDGSMWVWIPRYVYKVSSGWHSNTTGAIEAQFSMGTDDTINNTVTLDTGATSNASNNKWTNHPGFTFGSTEVTGIWVAKFEPTAAEGVATGNTWDEECIASDNVSTKTIKVIPNALSWRCITIGNTYTAIRNMEANGVYGWPVASTLKSDGTYTTDTNNVDTHLMKNIEWGAVAYLSKSSYGKNTVEVWINNNQNYITGCAGTSAVAVSYDGCQNTYETTDGVQASTTGNIYGIYDMSGSAWERLSAYVDNGNINVNGQNSSVINALGKYKDIYQKNTTDDDANNYLLTIQKKGDAVYETSSNGIDTNLGWFGDYTAMPSDIYPWFGRGSSFYYDSYAGLFSFFYSNGEPRNISTFRPVVLVSKGF